MCILTIRKTLAPTRSVTQMFKKIKKLLSVDGPTKVFESESPQSFPTVKTGTHEREDLLPFSFFKALWTSL